MPPGGRTLAQIIEVDTVMLLATGNARRDLLATERVKWTRALRVRAREHGYRVEAGHIGPTAWCQLGYRVGSSTRPEWPSTPGATTTADAWVRAGAMAQGTGAGLGPSAPLCPVWEHTAAPGPPHRRSGDERPEGHGTEQSGGVVLGLS